MLFSQSEGDYEIKMVNIDSAETVPESADLIESVQGNPPWTRGWDFLRSVMFPSVSRSRQTTRSPENQ